MGLMRSPSRGRAAASKDPLNQHPSIPFNYMFNEQDWAEFRNSHHARDHAASALKPYATRDHPGIKVTPNWTPLTLRCPDRLPPLRHQRDGRGRDGW
jgi:hypothetical protein